MALIVTKGRVGALYLATGTSTAASNVAMSEVNLSADPTNARPRYSVYEIPNTSLSRNLDDAVTPVFQYSAGGTAALDTIPGTVRVEYPNCRIYLGTPLASADTVQLTSGNVIVPTFVSGVKNWSFDAGWDNEKLMFLRDTAKTTVLKQKEWTANAELARVAVCATFTTSLGTNKDLTWMHYGGGTDGNDISVAYSAPSGTATTITITGSDIVVAPKTGETALGVMAEANKSALLKELKVSCTLKAGETGTAAVDTVTHTHLSGGLDPVDWSAINGTAGITSAVAEFYSDYDNKIRWVDYAICTKVGTKVNADGVQTETLTFESRGGQNCGPFQRTE